MNINFEKYEVDEETRSITFSCASDLPYERWDEQGKYPYDEILAISDESIDLTRLNDGASVLFNHDTDELLGCVDRAYIMENKLYVQVRFSRNSDFAVRIYQDILDGVIRNVSIGYQVQHYSERRDGDKVIRIVDRWMPYECSIVSIPADETVGIRSMEEQNGGNTGMEEENKPIEEKASGAVENEGAETRIDTLVAEVEELKAKVKELEKPAEETSEGDDAVDASANDEENAEEIKACGEALDVPAEEVEKALESKMSARDFKKVYRNYCNTNITGGRKSMNKGFAEYLREGNFNEKYTLRSGDYAGFGGLSGEGGAPLIGTETKPLVKALEKVIGVKGYRTLTGLTSNITIPVQTGRHTAYQTDNLRDAATTSNPVFTSKTLSPVKISGNTRIGKELLAQANDDVVSFIVDSLTAEIGYKVENYLLDKVASGASGSVTYSALSAIDWSDILAFESAVSGYVLTTPSFVMSPSARAALKGIEKATGTAQFLCNDHNEINGYSCSVSGCVTNNDIYFGDWGKLLLGIWGDMDVVINPYTYAKEGDVEVVASIMIDAVVEQSDAFVIGSVEEDSNSGNLG